jgi:hypothetical protein
MKTTQDGGAVAWLLWTVFVLTALVALTALGIWHALEAIDHLGPLRVVIDGRDVLDGIRWSDFSEGERVSFVLLVGFALVLMLLLVLPLVVIGALVIPLVVTLLVIAISLAPIVLPVLLIIWLVRRGRRDGGATIST